MGSELFHSDRQAHMTEVLVAFRNSAKALKRDNDALLSFVSANCCLHECKYDDIIEKLCWWGTA